MGISPEIKFTFSAENVEQENEVIDQIEELLPLLPNGPKKEEIVIEYEECSVIVDFKNVLAKIKKLLKKIEIHQAQPASRFFVDKEKFFESNFSDIEKEKTLNKINEIILEALNSRMVNIGEGRVAQVFISEKYPDFCYKIIINHEQYNLENDISTEAEYMQDLVETESQGVRCPKPYYYKMDDKNHLLVMERFRAISLDKILNNEYPVPPNFNFDDFFNSLEEYIHAIHRQNIFHRDLHSGNIMINLHTLKPVVIDFGRSKKTMTSDSDEAYLIKDHLTGKVSKYTDDFIRLSQLKNEFRKFIYKRGEAK